MSEISARDLRAFAEVVETPRIRRERKQQKNAALELAARESWYSELELRRQEKRTKRTFGFEARPTMTIEGRTVPVVVDVPFLHRTSSGRKRSSKPFGSNPRQLSGVAVSFTPKNPELVWMTETPLYYASALLNGHITEKEWDTFYRWFKLAEDTPKRKPKKLLKRRSTI